jgi:hypothetical protein
MKLIFSKRAPLTFAAFLAAAAIAACKSDTTGTSATPAAVAASTSPPASSTAGASIPGPSVIVTDAGGAPAAGVSVNFAVTAGGGTVQYPTVTTGADGIASSGTWHVGAFGANTLTATVEGLPALTFSTTAQLGNAAQIIPAQPWPGGRSGNNQVGRVSSDLPIPLTVQVLSAGGIGVPGQTVTFTVTTGGGSIAGSPQVTDANGFATSGVWTLGPNYVNNTVVAQTGTLQTTFTAIIDPCRDRTPLAVGQTVNGALAFGASRCAIGGAAADRYLLSTANEAVNIALSSAAFDALLNVWTTNGVAQVATNDNDPAGGTTNSVLRLIAAPGTSTVDATSASAGKTGAYTLSVTSTSADVADCSKVYIEIGATTTQNLATTDCKTNFAPAATAAQTGEGVWKNTNVSGDAFLVYIAAGTTVRISQTAQPLDAAIAFYAPDGSLLLFRDNGGVGATQTEVINYTSTVSGYYKIVAGSYCLLYNDPYQAGCDYGPYTLSVITP